MVTKYLLPESWFKVSNFKSIFLSSAEKKLSLRKRLLSDPDIGPHSFETFRYQIIGPIYYDQSCNHILHCLSPSICQ